MGPSAPSITVRKDANDGVLAGFPFAIGNTSERPSEPLEDDRKNLRPGDAVLLIVEDDVHYARMLCDLSREKGFKVLMATRGSEALALAREFHPSAVSLDVF